MRVAFPFIAIVAILTVVAFCHAIMADALMNNAG
jgi:hypothetical protein